MPRTYKKGQKNSEYEYQSSEKQKKDRAGRNKANAIARKAGKIRKGDGKDIDHKDKNPRNNKKKNLQVQSKSKNRSFARNFKAQRKKT